MAWNYLQDSLEIAERKHKADLILDGKESIVDDIDEVEDDQCDHSDDHENGHCVDCGEYILDGAGDFYSEDD